GFLLDWRYHVNRAAQKTGVVWPAQSDDSDAKVEQFLTMELYRERATIEDVGQHPNITALVRATYTALTKMSADGDREDLRGELDLLRAKFDESCELFGAALAAEELVHEQLRTELHVQTAEANAQREANSRLAATSEQQSQQIRGLETE